MADNQTPAKYDTTKMEAVVLEMAVELHPRRPTAGQLSLAIVSDATDEREVETAARATRNLRDSGLLNHRDDGIIEPTQAGLRAVELLTR